MSERLETLNKARARMIEDRDLHAKVLAAPFDRDKAERARNKFIEIQALVDALDRAISGEEVFSPKSWTRAEGKTREQSTMWTVAKSADARLLHLEGELTPDWMTSVLRERELFPDVDHLFASESRSGLNLFRSTVVMT
jgi:hypothetical protein